MFPSLVLPYNFIQICNFNQVCPPNLYRSSTVRQEVQEMWVWSITVIWGSSHVWVSEWKSLSDVWLFATTWTIDCPAPLSMGSPGKNTAVGCHFLLQGVFPTQGSNPGLPHCRQILYHLSHQGSPSIKDEKKPRHIVCQDIYPRMQSTKHS